MAAVDPFELLGVPPGTAPEELAAAYRRQAKRWHPDRGGGEAAARRMAEINAAYDLLRDGGWRSALAEATARRREERAPRRRRAKGSWLSADVREAMGGELLAALRDGEDVRLVTPAATWASPTAVLAVTDQRLLWLNDDAIGQRVQSVPFREVDEIALAARRLRRHVAAVRVRTVRNRRLTFSELRPATAQDIVRRVTEARRSAA